MSFPSLREFMDAVSARWPTALTVLLGSSGVLYTAANGYQYVSDLPSAVLTTCFILAIFAGASLASTSIEATFSALKRVIGWMRSNSVKTERLAMLLDLPFDEHLVMSMLFTNKKPSFPRQSRRAKSDWLNSARPNHQTKRHAFHAGMALLDPSICLECDGREPRYVYGARGASAKSIYSI